jgi:hypothetical protein
MWVEAKDFGSLVFEDKELQYTKKNKTTYSTRVGNWNVPV